jgi:hypothetical protein
MEGTVGRTQEKMRHRLPIVGCPASHADADTDPEVWRQHILAWRFGSFLRGQPPLPPPFSKLCPLVPLGSDRPYS